MATLGQTFHPPAEFPRLARFEFLLQSTILTDGPDDLDFAAYIVEWNSAFDRATGPILYRSAPQRLPFPAHTPTWYSFSPRSLLLDPARQYMALLSVAGLLDGVPGSASVGILLGADRLPGEMPFYAPQSRSFDQLFTHAWSPVLGPDDLAFRAVFVAVPEPATYSLIAAGILLASLVTRRQRSITKRARLAAAPRELPPSPLAR